MLARTLTDLAVCHPSETPVRVRTHTYSVPTDTSLTLFRPELAARYAGSERRRGRGPRLRVQNRRMPEVLRCQPAGRDRALGTVLAAFATDPLLRWVWPDDARYAACATRFFGLLVDIRLEGGEVWTADGGAAVALWDPPGGLYREVPGERWAAVQEHFSQRERDAWATYDAALSVPAEAGPHWYLGVLATEPSRQGQGLGRAVTAPMLTAADRAGLPAYLETASEANVAIYRRLGFEPVRDVVMPGTGPACWLMRRDPRPVVAP